ncbi:unnamed protein product [Caenorhabditis bovis]|uniref:C2H2-type domain-containing protein n=1 Tax=Caenorhabditis bovis TaxID=2654633 RepID=A0A8S1F3Z5_9PELO|nr:unnamed protein product [Caenorhabditis bovis]
MNATSNLMIHRVVEKNGFEKSVEFRCGDTKGPFKVTCRQLDYSSTDGSLLITMNNLNGERIRFEMENDEILKRLKPCANPLLANCVVLHTEHTCPKCKIAKFSSVENLKVHTDSYCSNRDESWDFKRNETSSVILVPLAYHDLPQQQAVQLLGPVHSVVPVAIGRSTGLLKSNPLFVQNTQNIQIPNSLNIKLPQLSINIPIVNLDDCAPIAPLDLSKCELASSSASSSPKSKISEFPEKPFSCSCGVSFSNEKTFDAHKNFYCKNSEAANAAAKAETSKKVPEKCSQCDFRPSSTSHLAMHIRTAHQALKTYTCQVCGYRAFSMRGIRTHMRNHSPGDSQRFEAGTRSDEK